MNIALLHQQVGPDGRIVGVDITNAMMEQATARIVRKGWNNIELVLQNASLFEFPNRVDGMLSTYALSLIPEITSIIEKASTALNKDGRIAILDLKVPEKLPHWITRLLLPLVSPFAFTKELILQKPWERIKEKMMKLFNRLITSICMVVLPLS